MNIASINRSSRLLAIVLAAAVWTSVASVASAASSNDRVPATVASCRGDATGRNTLPFQCPGTATQWVIGTAPSFSCYAPATTPTCNATTEDFSCNTGACVCKSGFTNCGSGCVATPFPVNNCAPGQTYNSCTGCSGNVNVTLQSGAPVRQGAAATNATISVHGNLDLAGGTQGDIYMGDGREIFVNGAAATNLDVVNNNAVGATVNFNVGTLTNPGIVNAYGGFWLDDNDASGRGIQLEAADRPIITRGWDTFSSGSLAGVGRWGLYMQPNVLAMGVPNAAGKSWAFRSFNADSTFTDRLTVDGSTGATVINGSLNVTGATTLNSLNVTGGATFATAPTFSSGFRLTTGAAAGHVLTSDASGNGSWQAPAAGSMGGSGTAGKIAKFSAASALADSLMTEDTEGVGVNLTDPTGLFQVAATPASGSVVTVAGFSNGVSGVTGTGARIYLSGTSNNMLSASPRGVYLSAVNTGGGGNGNSFIIETNNNSNPPVERMRVTHQGRVGIGNAAPATELDVTGSGTFSSNLTVGGTLSVTGSLSVAPNTDTLATIGRADIGCASYPDYACFSHVDQDATGTYALLQYFDGRTFLNSAPSQPLYLRIGNANRIVINPSGNLVDVQGMTTAEEGIALGGKLGISGGYAGDTWLRLNESSDFTSGVYTPGKIRADGGIQLSSSSSQYIRRYNSSWIDTNTNFWGRGAIQADEGVYAYASTAAAALTATSNSAGSWAAAINGNSYTAANGSGQDGSMWIGGSLDVTNDVSLNGKHAFRGNDSWLRLNQDGAFSSGTHTPGFFNARAMSVGTLYTSPGSGNLEVQGTIVSNYYVGTIDVYTPGLNTPESGGGIIQWNGVNITTADYMVTLAGFLNNASVNGECHIAPDANGVWRWSGRKQNGSAGARMQCQYAIFKFR